ncbi:hypothetical protein AB0I22_24035 [Streptomyces sp. NPDC050610]|uniref:hypothetical protein n=1 Tax=Streptomyces sp. NPDC050610 TaxID=3157097 RepID=UPI003417CE0C
MMAFGKRQEPAVVVLRDADTITAALHQALGAASPEERPGLEAALALATEAASAPESELRARWVRNRLAATGYDGPVDDSVAAVKALRQAEPGLSLLQAATLTKEAAAARH